MSYAPPPGPTGYYRPPQTAGKATAALVLAILSWVVCPFIPAVVALILASQATDEIRASGGTLTGESLITAARIIAWIHLGFVGLAVLAIIAISLLGATASTV